MSDNEASFSTKDILYRFLPVAIVFIVALEALERGVTLSERDMGDNVWEHTYYVVGLFGLGGMDLGFPNGGPLEWQYALLACFFIAPMISLVAIFEGLWVFVEPWYRQMFPWRNHIVVVGAGRVGQNCIHQLIKHGVTKRKILVVDNQDSFLRKDLFKNNKNYYVRIN